MNEQVARETDVIATDARGVAFKMIERSGWAVLALITLLVVVAQ